jgi:hypothetical protein
MMKAIALVLTLLATPAAAASYCTSKSDGTPRIQKQAGQSCPSGYFASGDCCEAFHKDAKGAVPKIEGKSCTSGTYASGGFCESFR